MSSPSSLESYQWSFVFVLSSISLCGIVVSVLVDTEEDDDDNAATAATVDAFSFGRCGIRWPSLRIMCAVASVDDPSPEDLATEVMPSATSSSLSASARLLFSNNNSSSDRI